MKEIKIVCIGDSLTEGYGLSENERWTNLLSAKLDIEIINSGISGDTTAGILSRFKEDVIQHDPSHVLIMGGTNDLYFNLPDNIIVANIMAMTRRADHHGILPIVGVPTPVYDDDIFQKSILSFQESLKQFLIEDEQEVIDFSHRMKSECYLVDGVHPNELGHEIMTATAFEYFKEVLV